MPLGQKWQRTKVGKKTFLAANEVRQHAPRGGYAFSLSGEDDGFDFIYFVPNVFPSCPQVPNKIPNKFPRAPHFIPFPLP
jgi:hypothetical protein